MQQQNRNPAIDIARGIAILLVVGGHALEIFFNHHLRADGAFNIQAYESWRFIYSFHIPALYFVSGMAALTLEQKPFAKVCQSSLALILFACLTDILAFPLSAGTLRDFVRPLVYLSGFTLIVMWFLVSLAFVRLTAWGYLRSNVAVRIFIVAAVICAYAAAHSFYKTYFGLQALVFGMAFFLAGQAFMRRIAFPGQRPRRGWAILSAVGLLAVYVLYPLNQGCLFDPFAVCVPPGKPGFAVLLVDGEVGFLPLFFAASAAGIMAVIGAAAALTATTFGKILAWVGRHTIELLVLNGVFLAMAEPGLAQRLDGTSGTWALWAGGLTILQLAVLPVAAPVLTWLYALCGNAAARLSGTR